MAPTAHAVQLVEPRAAANSPGWHGSHDVAPILAENVPGAQGVHEREALSFANVPGRQNLQLSALPFDVSGVDPGGQERHF
ncbi:uncharacterized protein PITG_08091 [Phytophthora infestans T30-4]|uniref:Uncharacterized protein n=1 Tax=Phytophthora infestans (strain T30-4) TaxID=403677 RepID=D0N9F9_PHYIT|nr:uncharacterized protein PITG_08091 [Phytophthora infestans T30-4]EEY54447.1 hypothetical protein PITG_08091 [Phytophthora infestans T30-4]|eukprot:XP_002904269.1 hypothetical protein PITG_08091 [Phytophthora infestans T30-4]